MRRAIEALRSPEEPRAGARPDRGDVRTAVLTALAEQPMNGYQIVRALEERGLGPRSPGAGAVYPTLQLLADEGLAVATEEGGKKTYSLTVLGRVAAEAAKARPLPSEARAPERRGALPKAAAQLAQATALVAQSGTHDQVAEAVAALDEARRKLHAILARN